MKKYEKEVQQAFLNNEEAVIKRLKSVYNQSLKDVTAKAEALQKDIERLDTLAKLSIDDEEKEKILSQRRSKVYQKKYQDSLKKQASDILDNMHENEYKTVSDYLVGCYDEGFLGAMYSLQQQGIPLAFPIDQTQLVKAVQLDSKISQGLYSRLGEDVSLLKRKITAQVSRGISTGMTFPQIAKQLAGVTNIGFNNAVRIARTEGHRIQCQSGMDACYKAKEKGADVVKQWDSTLDSRTRESHVAVHGEIRELDEKFSNGLRFPSDPHGSAAEVVNCRCALLQRAKWALDEEELIFLKASATFFGIDKSNSFEDFKKKYLKAVSKIQKTNLTNTSKSDITKMSNVEVRKWYIEQVSKIADSIDETLPTEEKARQAFEARNKIRTEARNLMADEKTKALLDAEKPNKTFEELIESKMKRKGMTREEAIEDIYKTATKTNADINTELGLDGD